MKLYATCLSADLIHLLSVWDRGFYIPAKHLGERGGPLLMTCTFLPQSLQLPVPLHIVITILALHWPVQDYIFFSFFPSLAFHMFYLLISIITCIVHCSERARKLSISLCCFTHVCHVGMKDRETGAEMHNYFFSSYILQITACRVKAWGGRPNKH